MINGNVDIKLNEVFLFAGGKEYVSFAIDDKEFGNLFFFLVFFILKLNS